jgi:hypothetical protein
VVRAAKGRADRSPEKRTIQHHTQEALRRWDMSITGLDEFDCIREAGIVNQRETDLGTAKGCTEPTGIAHAFGDGATWQKEGITGWGMHIIREGEDTIEDWGRTPGNQNNDASETYTQYYIHYCIPTPVVTYTCIVTTKGVYTNGGVTEKEKQGKETETRRCGVGLIP